MSEQIERCQVFTPVNKVRKVLDLVNYQSNILDKKIMENSFGEGDFLYEIVERFICEAQNKGYSPVKIKSMLEEHIYGNEIDKKLYELAKQRLNNFCSKHGIYNVNWSFRNVDTLRYTDHNKYDFIVGNPPYISYHKLSIEDRQYIKENYNYCKKGLFDIYYAFTEWAMTHVEKEKGQIAYIIPNGVYKNKSADSLRKDILLHLHNIIDYKRINVFEGKLTTVTILHLDFSVRDNYVSYTHNNYTRRILRDNLEFADKWVFINQSVTKGDSMFGDFFEVKNSIATLHNKIFVLKDYEESEEFIIIKEGKIEKEMVRNAISIRSLKKPLGSELIIFPYIVEDGQVTQYDEAELKTRFPHAYRYLKSKKKELSKETRDISTKWFEYGRTQSLYSTVKQKVLIPRILSNDLYTVILEEDIVPYSGIVITQKRNLTLTDGVRILSSKRFFSYLNRVSSNLQGKSIQVSTNDIKRFRFDINENNN